MSCHVTDVSHTDLNLQHVRYTNEGTKDSVTNTAGQRDSPHLHIITLPSINERLSKMMVESVRKFHLDILG